MDKSQEIKQIAKAIGAKVALDLKGMPWVNDKGQDRLYNPYKNERDFLFLLMSLQRKGIGVFFTNGTNQTYTVMLSIFEGASN